MNPEIEELEKSLQKQIDNINDAITRTRNNELVDISYMDEEVASLCQKILSADEQTNKHLESKMVEMISLLDSFAQELKDYQDRTNPQD